MTKSPGQDAADECQYKSFNDEETQVGVVELEASQLMVIDPDLLENGLMDAAVCKKSGFELKLLENHRYCVRLEYLETISQGLYLLKACPPRAKGIVITTPLFHQIQKNSFE